MSGGAPLAGEPCRPVSEAAEDHERDNYEHAAYRL